MTAAGPATRTVFFQQLAGSRDLLQGFTPRRVAGRVSFKGKATAVVGMRRAGKTTLLHQLRAERARDGSPPSSLPMLSLEDERFADLTAAGLGGLVDEYMDRQFTEVLGSYPVVWFLDEIQVVPGWERLVRRLLDTPGVEVFVSGSSADLLSREIATALRGRGWQVLIHPFGFDEALRHRGVTPPPDPAMLSRPERARLESLFGGWLSEGGFPEAQNLDPRHPAAAPGRLRGRGGAAQCRGPSPGQQRGGFAPAGAPPTRQRRLALQRGEVPPGRALPRSRHRPRHRPPVSRPSGGQLPRPDHLDGVSLRAATHGESPQGISGRYRSSTGPGEQTPDMRWKPRFSWSWNDADARPPTSVPRRATKSTSWPASMTAPPN